jgi:archaetidylinositol phosphate synthase
MLSFIGVAFSILSGLAYLFSKYTLFNNLLLAAAPIFLLISGFCDLLDGALARIYEQTTVLGGFLDSLLDRYSDAIVICGIILGEFCNVFWGLIALTGSLLVSYTRARAEEAGVKMAAIGVAERAERLIILITASFFSLVWPKALSFGVIVLGVLANITVLQRVVYFIKQSR